MVLQVRPTSAGLQTPSTSHSAGPLHTPQIHFMSQKVDILAMIEVFNGLKLLGTSLDVRQRLTVEACEWLSRVKCWACVNGGQSFRTSSLKQHAIGVRVMLLGFRECMIVE